MKFILAYPEHTGPDGDLLDAGDVTTVARAAEAAGFWGFALTEHPIPGARWLNAGGHQTLDPFVGLAFAGAATESLRLLTYVTVVPYRNPCLLAKAASTLDRLSGGRFTLGVGTGYQKSEYYALGVDLDERNELFDEALDVLPLAWSGEPFSYHGKHFDARDVQQLPRPSQQPIPIWIGGNSRLTRRRVAERAQGWMPLSGTAELAQTARTPALGALDELAATIRELREAAGERPIDVVLPFPDRSMLTDAASAGAQRELMEKLESIGVTHTVVSGPGERLVELIEGFGAAHLGAL